MMIALRLCFLFPTWAKLSLIVSFFGVIQGQSMSGLRGYYGTHTHSYTHRLYTVLYSHIQVYMLKVTCVVFNKEINGQIVIVVPGHHLVVTFMNCPCGKRQNKQTPSRVSTIVEKLVSRKLQASHVRLISPRLKLDQFGKLSRCPLENCHEEKYHKEMGIDRFYLWIATAHFFN